MKHKSIRVVLAALALAMALVTPALAVGSTTASVPVTLTVAKEYVVVNVTVPASLPVYVINGKTFTADNARITNNSGFGAVRVTSVTVTDGAYKVTDYNSFTGSKVIALKINGCTTKGSGAMAIDSAAFPMLAAGESMPLTYDARVSGDAEPGTVNAANVVFTISAV